MDKISSRFHKVTKLHRFDLGVEDSHVVCKDSVSGSSFHRGVVVSRPRVATHGEPPFPI